LKKISIVIIIGLLCFSMFSIFAPQVKATTTLPWQDDFNYNTLDEMRAAGWRLDTQGWSLSPSIIRFDNTGAEGSSAYFLNNFPSQVYEFRVEAKCRWVGRDYGQPFVSVITQHHGYLWTGDGYYHNYVFNRDGAEALRFDGYTPTLNTWMTFALEKKGNTFYLYQDGQLKNTYTETDVTPDELVGVGIGAGWVSTMEYDYISVTELAEKSILIVNSPGTFGETWYLPDGTPFTLMSFLQGKGFPVDVWTDISNGRALSLDILSSYDAVILPSWFFDTPDNLQYQNALLDYVSQGGGLLFAGQSGFAQTLDGSLGFKYVDGGFVDATIVDSSHPVMQGISELPKAGGVFVDWDNVIADSPLPSNVAILARTTDSSNRIALIAFQYGNGRVVAGPSDGLLRPYGPTGVDSWDVISEPIIENRLLINAINWVARARISWEYVFKDPKRGTMLKISTDDKYFQFTAPNKDFGIKYDPKMTICRNIVTICYNDKEMCIAAIAATGKIKACAAIVLDKSTRRAYLLISTS
jgi:uncharacterized membrane protein